MVRDASHELRAKPLVIPEIVSFPVEVDLSNSDALRAALSAAIRPGVAVVVADLSRTKFCDGAGIRCLLAAHDQAIGCGVELRAVIRSSAVWRLLVLLGGDEKLHVYPDMKAGLTGPPGAARRSRTDEDPASSVAGVLGRSHDVLRVACDMAERVAATRENLRQHRSETSSESLRNSEFARLFKRVSTMPVIEQAKGILMYYERCSPAEAFDMLRRASQRSNVPVRDIAANIVERTSG